MIALPLSRFTGLIAVDRYLAFGGLGGTDRRECTQRVVVGIEDFLDSFCIATYYIVQSA
jgi:hypothetical protein